MTQLHPQIRAILDRMATLDIPPIESLDPLAAREQMEAMTRARGGDPLPIAKAEDRTVPGPAGDIPVRIYWPNEEGVRGAYVYFHGGGHVIGSLDTHDKVARNLCNGGGVVVISVDYRMGPEDKYPAAVEDCWAVTEWVAANAASIGADPARIAVGGDSAGGNLAAVIALMARDAGAPKISLQVLVYPVGDYTLSGGSVATYAKGYGILTDDAMKWFQGHYFEDVSQASEWKASPINAASFEGVAPAIIIAAGCDVLYDDGVDYARALAGAGVPCEYVLYAGMIHAFFGMAPDVDDAVAAQTRVSEALRKALA